MSSRLEEKREARARYKALRAAIDGEQKALLDDAICARIISLSSFRFADTVLTYSPIGSEINVNAIALRALELGKKVAFPVCNKETREMTFKYVGSLDELASGAYSIPEPNEDAECFSHLKHSICIVPALSIDKRGFRLGYGGGYYDKFLKKFDGVVLGVAYDALIADTLPTGVYDVPVDVIITERRSIIPNAKK
jgi:5-formyltetrahydrofolate cyclo-ligase